MEELVNTQEKKVIIKVEGIRKVYNLGQEKVIALDNIDLDIYKGEILCIFGTSGSGKSTLLNMLAGLEKPTKGKVLFSCVPPKIEFVSPKRGQFTIIVL